jgi:hypothetical protein
VFPAEGFAGRHVRVEVSGEETQWVDGATVSFGDGITVSNVVVASESAIFADLDIAPTAALSDHDVTVTSGKETDTLTAAFKVESPVEVTIQGTAAQGSIGSFTITNHDLENLFDTTSVSSNPFLPPEYTNIALEGGPGVTLQLNSVTPFDITGFILIDVDAPASATINVASGPSGGTQVTSVAAPLPIMARTPTMLTADTPVTGSVTNAGDSTLYSFTPASFPALGEFSVSTNDPDAGPQVAVLPESGHFADAIALSSPADVLLRSGSVYVIQYDLSGVSGFSYQLSASAPDLASTAADTEPANSTSAGATTLTGNALVDNASLTDIDDEDWFKLTVPAGKRIHVVTVPGDPLTDTVINIYGPNDDSALISDDQDATYHEDVTSDVTDTAGTYYVQIVASSYFDDSQSHYAAAIVVE